tara:strand:+ start:62 stop:820 length:759 start_codon:yes stop_codon:yes gene_type:complete
MLEILILSLVQGATEFIPVSSSSHLILISNYFRFENQNLMIDVSLHIGSFFAILFHFRNDVFNFFKNKKLFLKIFISSIPVMLVGYILIKYNLIDHLRNIKVIGWATIIFGILLFISDKSKKIKNINKNFNYKSAIVIGLFQVLSLIPGVSRSGVTITAGRFLEFERVEAAKISFLLSIPTLAAVSLFGINDLILSGDFNFSLLSLLSVSFSFIFSLITIKIFLKFIERFNLNIFVIYRILLGIIILVLSYL